MTPIITVIFSLCVRRKKFDQLEYLPRYLTFEVKYVTDSWSSRKV